MRKPLSHWLNSIQAYVLGLALGVIAALTAVSLTILYVVNPPLSSPLTVYEMARLVEGKPVVRAAGELDELRRQTPPPGPATATEQLISALLAERLGRPLGDVRVTLGREDRERGGTISREVALYGPDRMANPILVGSYTIALREGGGWRVIRHRSSGWFYLWRLTGWEVLGYGVLLVLPLTFWFSRRLARPIEAFADSAQRVGGGRAVEPVPLAGPTEIRLAAQALNEMQARVSRYVRERTTLTGAIAHDLRAPLSRLHFHLDSAAPEVRRAAEAEIREMERLIAGILDFVENDARPTSREPLDLSMLVEGVADDFADMGQDVTVTEAEPITTTGDPLLLRRLFVNVVENAVKYGRSARIAIRRAGGEAVVEVVDRGPGMSEDDIARAFEPFFRGEPSRNRETGGSGLGLAIVKSAADAHGATVELANAAGGGLAAKVRLPIVEPGGS